MLVSDILKTKGHEVQTVHSTTTLGELAIRLKAARVGVMIVSDDGRALDGIISERDIVGALADNGAGLENMRVGQISTKAVLTCGRDSTVGDVARLMTSKRIRHVPVVDGDRIVGIVSIGDVLKHRLDEMQLEANVLRDVAIAVR
ncbi:MAG: CBS domain-containing protein [Alphaproteobacteria bacterium]|nr:CBS domain-containing protein [Alphaproteobacteria bacterium]